ncbi:MAG: TSUP family transporter, partial [bacterium]
MLAASGWIAATFMGVTLGLIGGGGSILTVPILVYLLGVEPVRATGYSLFVVGATALVGAMRYVRSGCVDVRATLLFGLPSLIGVYAVRRWVMPALPDPLWSGGGLVVTKGLFVMIVFAIVMAIAAGSMILSKRGETDGAKPRAPRAA